MFRALLPKVLLVFTLLFAQLGGLTHGISHILAEQKQGSDQSLPHDKHCDLCAVYAQVGSAVTSSNVSFADGDDIETFHVVYSDVKLPVYFVAFSARAPPYSA